MMQAKQAPTMTDPTDKDVRARCRWERSGSRYNGVGLRSTRTIAGRFGVAGFILSIATNATIARAIARNARRVVSVAVTDTMAETKDDDTLIAAMTTDSVPSSFPPPSAADVAMSPHPAPHSRPNRWKPSIWAISTVTLSWCVLVVVVAMSLFRIERWEIAPGEALGVSSRISIDASDGKSAPERYVNDDGIRFVTAFGGQLSALDAFLGWLDPWVQVNTYEEQFGDMTPDERQRLGYQSMVGAKQIAEYVAAQRLGLNARLVEGSVLIEELVCDGDPGAGSACEVLEVGETIVSLDGAPTPTLSALSDVMKGRSVGDKVTIEVLPYRETDSTKTETHTVTLMENPEEAGVAIIGIVPADTRTVDLPFDVGISTTDIGGPSAGLAFTLALLDELTRGDLMGNGTVAATGTINEDGTVGPIGALVQKTIAVRDAGVRLFLVPAGQSDDELADARRAGGSKVKIVAVADLDAALDALEANGGDPLP